MFKVKLDKQGKYFTGLIRCFIRCVRCPPFADSPDQGRRLDVNWGGGGIFIFPYCIFMFYPTSFFSNLIQIDQFEKKSVCRQNM